MPKTIAEKVKKKTDDAIDPLTEIPVRKTEGGKYGENAEHAEGIHQPTADEQTGRSYFAPKELRNKTINKMIEDDGG